MSARPAEQITGPVAHHGEGPTWWPSWGGLAWVDMMAGDVLHLRHDGSVGRHHVGAYASSVQPRARGGAVVVRDLDYLVVEESDWEASLVEGKELVGLPVGLLGPSEVGEVLNESAVDPFGRMYCGSAVEFSDVPRGRLVRVTEQDQTEVLSGVAISNGLAWTQSGRQLYYVDSGTQRLDVLDVRPDGSLENRRQVVKFHPDEGTPDGMCMDEEGCLWVALWGGSAVERVSPEGRRLERVDLPVPMVTSCAFGGPDLRTLYITTSKLETDEREHPQAGALFTYRSEVPGRLMTPYRG